MCPPLGLALHTILTSGSTPPLATTRELKMRLAAGLSPDQLGEVTALPQTSYLDSTGPTSKGKGGGNAPNFVSKFIRLNMVGGLLCLAA